MNQTEIEDKNWQTQKMCVDVADYELCVKKQKNHWHYEQKREDRKWAVSYHGSIVSSGSVNSVDEAKERALSNLPGKLIS